MATAKTCRIKPGPAGVYLEAQTLPLGYCANAHRGRTGCRGTWPRFQIMNVRVNSITGVPC